MANLGGKDAFAFDLDDRHIVVFEAAVAGLRERGRTAIVCGPVTCDPPAFQATAPRPFFATSVRSFSEVPRGRFSPRSHWLTRPVVTLR